MTAPIISSVKTVSHAPGIESRVTTTSEIDRRDDRADHREGKPLERDGRRRHFRRDTVVEKHDLERLAGDAANREEADGVGRQAHAQQARERRACLVGERNGPAPGSQELPDRRGHEDHRQRQTQTAGAVERLVEINVDEGDDEQNDADDDGRHRHELSSGSSH